MITKFAVHLLIRALKKDEGYWYSWQANIAMAVYDSILKELQPMEKDRLHEDIKNRLHFACNRGANDFLNILTR